MRKRGEEILLLELKGNRSQSLGCVTYFPPPPTISTFSDPTSPFPLSFSSPSLSYSSTYRLPSTNQDILAHNVTDKPLANTQICSDINGQKHAEERGSFRIHSFHD